MARKTLRERLSGFRQKILGGVGKAATAGYKSHPPYYVRAVRDLPLFSFLTIQTMLRDPTVQLGLLMRSAPLCAAEFAYQDGDTWVPGVRADNPEVGEFVHKQLKRIWTHEIDKVLRDQIWGWSAGEVTYRVVGGKVHVDEFLDRSAYDTRALLCRGKVAGVRFDQVPGSGSINLTFPKCWWSSFNAEGGSPYGASILYGAYSPWWDKWQERGALDVRRLFMRKDSYGGADMTYPDGTTTYPDGTQVANFEIARQIVEQIEAGGVTTRPYVPGSDGKNQWELTRATIPSSPNHILDYPDRLDVEILRGIGVPDDVLTSESGGAWAGKQVPQAAFYTGLQRWLNQVIRTITVQILEPLVLLNWGRAEEFEVTTKPLAKQMQEQQKPPQGGQTPQEPPAPRADSFGQIARMALAPEDEAQVADIAAGRIVGAAESIVKAARMAIDQKAQRMASDDNEGRWVTIGAKNGKGGTPVKIDGQGNILKGPSGLAGKDVDDLDKGPKKPARKAAKKAAKKPTKSKLTIQQAYAALEDRGYKLDPRPIKQDFKAKKTWYGVTGPDGKTYAMTALEIEQFLATGEMPQNVARVSTDA